jgi:molybdate transport system permease protein
MDSLFALVTRSVIVAACGVLLAAPLALWLGHRLAKRRIRAAALVETLAMLPLVLPPVVSGFVLLYIFSPASPLGYAVQSVFGVRVPFTLVAAVLTAAVVSFPLFLRSVKVGFAGVPRVYEEVAATLGQTPRQVFWSTTFPLARAGVAAGVVLALARALGEFGATLVVAGNIPGRTQTLPLAIYRATQLGDTKTGWLLIGVAAALAFVLMMITRRLERA